MLQTILNYFQQNISLEQADDKEHQLKLATAALLIEMMQQDDDVRDDEIKTVRQILKLNFNLSENETLKLFELAQQELDNAVDSHQFTRLIAQHYTQAEKIKIIEYLWQIALVDAHLDPLEEHMVRHIAELIYVPHHEFIKAKHRVYKAL